MDDIAQEKILERIRASEILQKDMSKRVVVMLHVTDGEVRYYPVCDRARVLAAMTSSDLLTSHAMQCASALGFWFDFKHNLEGGSK
jgi:hypothetical protein